MTEMPEIQLLLRIAAEVNRALVDLRKIKAEFDQFMAEYPDSKRWISLNTRALGSIFHDFYTGVERIFVRIAKELNGGLPAGEDWHRQLLEDMTLTISGVRPPIISENLRVQLDEYLRFRHLFRNIYGYSLEADRLKSLAENFNETVPMVLSELEAFTQFLEGIAKP